MPLLLGVRMKLFVLLASLLLTTQVKADVITELGGGWKIPYTTSYLMQEDCKQAQVINPPLLSPEGRPWTPLVYSCGGDDPVFVGWPIAWEKNLEKGRFRIGWFHMSHWFDSVGELHMDCLCASWTKVWKRSKK